MEKQEFFPGEKIKIWANWTIDEVETNDEITLAICLEKDQRDTSIYNKICPVKNAYTEIYTEIDFSTVSQNFTEYRELWICLFFICEGFASSISKMIALKKNNSTINLSIFNESIFEYDKDIIVQNTIHALSNSTYLYNGNEIYTHIFNNKININKTCKINSGMFQLLIKKEEIYEIGLYNISIQIPETYSFNSNIIHSSFQLQRKPIELILDKNLTNYNIDELIIFEIHTQELNGNPYCVPNILWNITSTLNFEDLIDNGNGNYTFRFKNLKMVLFSEITIELEHEKYYSNLLKIPIGFSKKDINLTIGNSNFIEESIVMKINSIHNIDLSLMNRKQLYFQIFSAKRWISVPIYKSILIQENITIFVLLNTLFQYNFTKNAYFDCCVGYNEDDIYYSYNPMNYSINFSGYLSQFIKIHNITYNYKNLKFNLNITYNIESDDIKIQKLIIPIINIKIFQFYNSSNIKEIQQKSTNLNGLIIVELIDDIILSENLLYLRIDVFVNNFLNSNNTIEIDLSSMNIQKKTNMTLNPIGSPYLSLLLVISLSIVPLVILKKKRKSIIMNIMDLEFN